MKLHSETIIGIILVEYNKLKIIRKDFKFVRVRYNLVIGDINIFKNHPYLIQFFEKHNIGNPK